MSTRLVDGGGSSVERWRAGLLGPQLQPPPADAAPQITQASVAQSGSCPTCGQQHGASDADAYDEDYDYYWGEWRLPLWIALILQVPWRQRLDIFVIGLLIGLTIAGVALLWGLLLSRY